MKKLMSYIIVLVMLFSFMFSAGFRGNEFGTNRTKIVEKSKFIKKETRGTTYQGKFLDNNSAIYYYYLNDGSLFMGCYSIELPFGTYKEALTLYYSIKDVLVAKYGEAARTDEVWDNELFKDDWAYIETAMKLGHVMYYTIWELDGMRVCLQYVTGADCAIRVCYLEPNMLELSQQEQLQEKVDSIDNLY